MNEFYHCTSVLQQIGSRKRVWCLERDVGKFLQNLKYWAISWYVKWRSTHIMRTWENLKSWYNSQFTSTSLFFYFRVSTGVVGWNLTAKLLTAFSSILVHNITSTLIEWIKSIGCNLVLDVSTSAKKYEAPVLIFWTTSTPESELCSNRTLFQFSFPLNNFF